MPQTSSPTHTTISLSTTYTIPNINIEITPEQLLRDPELKDVLSDLPKEIFSLIVSARARAVEEEGEAVGERDVNGDEWEGNRAKMNGHGKDAVEELIERQKATKRDGKTEL